MPPEQAYRDSLLGMGHDQVVPPQRQYPSGKAVVASPLLLRAVWENADRQVLVGNDWEQDALLSELVEGFGIRTVFYNDTGALDMADTAVPPEGE